MTTLSLASKLLAWSDPKSMRFECLDAEQKLGCT
jgi:hypothetical protein